jgi:hypothetical protein
LKTIKHILLPLVMNIPPINDPVAIPRIAAELIIVLYFVASC